MVSPTGGWARNYNTYVCISHLTLQFGYMDCSAIRLRDEQRQREAHLAGESESLGSQCLTRQVFKRLTEATGPLRLWAWPMVLLTKHPSDSAWASGLLAIMQCAIELV